jgi:sarcosine oxidase subunit gamma
LRRRSALALAPGGHGRPGPAQIELNEIVFAAFREIAVLGDVAPSPVQAAAAFIGFDPPGPGRALRVGDVEAVCAGPSRWIVIVHGGAHAADAAPPGLAVTGLSAARVLIALSGPKARDALAKGASIDLSEAAFGPGAAAATRIGHVAATLWRPQEQDGLRILVARSYAQALADWLLLAGREYGVRVG